MKCLTFRHVFASVILHTPLCRPQVRASFALGLCLKLTSAPHDEVLVRFVASVLPLATADCPMATAAVMRFVRTQIEAHLTGPLLDEPTSEEDKQAAAGNKDAATMNDSTFVLLSALLLLRMLPAADRSGLLRAATPSLLTPDSSAGGGVRHAATAADSSASSFTTTPGDAGDARALWCALLHLLLVLVQQSYSGRVADPAIRQLCAEGLGSLQVGWCLNVACHSIYQLLQRTLDDSVLGCAPPAESMGWDMASTDTVTSGAEVLTSDDPGLIMAAVRVRESVVLQGGAP